MVPYVGEIAQLHTAQAQLSVLHSFDVVKATNLAGRFDPTGESKPFAYAPMRHRSQDSVSKRKNILLLDEQLMPISLLCQRS